MNIQIENSTLIRDINSKAVISTDRTALDKFNKQKQEKERINKLERDCIDLIRSLRLISSLATGVLLREVIQGEI